MDPNACDVGQQHVSRVGRTMVAYHELVSVDRLLRCLKLHVALGGKFQSRSSGRCDRLLFGCRSAISRSCRASSPSAKLPSARALRVAAIAASSAACADASAADAERAACALDRMATIKANVAMAADATVAPSDNASASTVPNGRPIVRWLWTDFAPGCPTMTGPEEVVDDVALQFEFVEKLESSVGLPRHLCGRVVVEQQGAAHRHASRDLERRSIRQEKIDGAGDQDFPRRRIGAAEQRVDIDIRLRPSGAVDAAPCTSANRAPT